MDDPTQLTKEQYQKLYETNPEVLGMQGAINTSVSDFDLWLSDDSKFEDFVGIGRERTLTLAEQLRRGGWTIEASRLLKANGLPHGPCNTSEI